MDLGDDIDAVDLRCIARGIRSATCRTERCSDDVDRRTREHRVAPFGAGRH